MATFNQFEIFAEHLCEKVHDFNAAGDTLNIYLSNTAPNVATNWEYTPDAADVDAPGTYRLYLRATYPGPVTKRFPENQQRYYAEIVIQESFE